ncbi:hypothetical protein K8I61_14740 [bacterium]|nr:hypothetical protein [bacterium]
MRQNLTPHPKATPSPSSSNEIDQEEIASWLDLAAQLSVPKVCVTTHYDEKGRENGSMSDVGCNGTFRDCSELEYDEFDKVVSLRSDEDCDGSPELCTSVDIDEETGDERGSVDTDCDGFPEYVVCFEKIYDDQNREIRAIMRPECSDDEPPVCTEVTYNEAGDFRRAIGTRCDGKATSSSESVLNENGQIVFGRFLPIPKDPASGFCSHMRYDGSGELYLGVMDNSCDGRFDDCTWTSHDGAGRKVTREDKGCHALPVGVAAELRKEQAKYSGGDDSDE